MKIFKFPILILIFSLTAKAQEVSTTPDEAKLHELYQNYYSQPTNEADWSKALLKMDAQTYEIQKGDTLWEISDVFFGDPNFWPKLWSLNTDKMTNPHEISKGNMIQFIPGSGFEPPQLAVQKAETLAKDSENKEEEKVAEEEWWKSNIVLELPPPKKVSAPIQDPPSSFPAWEYLVPSAVKINSDFSRKLPSQQQVENPVLVNELVSEQNAKVGKILKTFTDATTSSDTQFVYIQFSETPQGQQFSSFTTSPKNGYTEIRYEGDLELLELVSADDVIYKAQVKKTYSPVTVGSYVQSGSVPRFDPSSAMAQDFGKPIPVIGFPTQSQSYYAYSQGFVYLEGGQNEGLKNGQVLSVFRIPEIDKLIGTIKLKKQKVGEIKIIRVQDQVATAVVLQSDEEILIGYTL